MTAPRVAIACEGCLQAATPDHPVEYDWHIDPRSNPERMPDRLGCVIPPELVAIGLCPPCHAQRGYAVTRISVGLAFVGLIVS